MLRWLIRNGSSSSTATSVPELDTIQAEDLAVSLSLQQHLVALREDGSRPTARNSGAASHSSSRSRATRVARSPRSRGAGKGRSFGCSRGIATFCQSSSANLTRRLGSVSAKPRAGGSPPSSEASSATWSGMRPDRAGGPDERPPKLDPPLSGSDGPNSAPCASRCEGARGHGRRRKGSRVVQPGIQDGESAIEELASASRRRNDPAAGWKP